MNQTIYRPVRVCVSCGKRPEYSPHIESESIACPGGCTAILIKGGARPEDLEMEWNAVNNIALRTQWADTPFDEYFDANAPI